MAIFEGFPLRKILKREVLLLVLCSPVFLELILTFVLVVYTTVNNADYVLTLSEEELMTFVQPATNTALVVGSLLGVILMTLAIIWRKIPLINRKHLSREEWKIVPGIDRQDWKFLAWYIPITYIGLIVGEILLSNIFENNVAVNQQAIEAMVGSMPMWAMFIILVIAAPLTEEWLFRGLILFRRDTLDATWLATIVSAVLFGLVHVPTNIPSAFSYIGMGFIFAYAAKHTKSVESAIVYHMINNFIAFIALYTQVF